MEMATIRRRQTPSGIRYDVRFRVNGIRRTRTFRTREDANSFRWKVEGEELAGLVDDPKGGERLFGEFRRGLGVPTTGEGSAAHRVHCAGLPSLTPASPQPCLRSHTTAADHARACSPVARRAAEFSRDQAAKGYRLLRAIFNTALADGLIGRNPCTIRGAGIGHAHERPMLDTTTVLELSEAIEARLRCLVLLDGLPACEAENCLVSSAGTSIHSTAR